MNTDTQPDLSPPPPAQRHSPTSIAAATAIEPDNASLRGRVLAYLRARGSDGATDEEMQHALGMNPSTQRPRRIELVDAGYVTDSFSKRKTQANRNAVVWVAIIRGV